MPSSRNRPGRGVMTMMRLRQIDRLEHRMGDEHHGLAQLSPQRQEIAVEPEAGDLVERRERLVHQQHLRLGDQRARDRHPHLHAAGQFARIGLREIGEADARSAASMRPALRPRRRRASRNGSRTLPRTVAHGIRVGSWNTKPIPGCAAPPCRDIRTVPVAGCAQARRSMRSAVDLPQPEGPSSDRNSPSRTARSRPSSATTPLANVLRHAAQADGERRQAGLDSPTKFWLIDIDAALRLGGAQLDADALVDEAQRVGLAEVEIALARRRPSPSCRRRSV